MWDSEMVIVLRHMIDDFETPYAYSDDKLQQILLIGGNFVQMENNFPTSYAISVENLTLKPDPTNSNTKDQAFVNLTILKTMCLLGNGALRKAAKTSMMAKEGSISFDNRGKFDAQKLMAQSWVQEYENAKWEYAKGSMSPGRAILSPYQELVATDRDKMYLYNRRER